MQFVCQQNAQKVFQSSQKYHPLSSTLISTVDFILLKSDVSYSIDLYRTYSIYEYLTPSYSIDQYRTSIFREEKFRSHS